MTKYWLFIFPGIWLGTFIPLTSARFRLHSWFVLVKRFERNNGDLCTYTFFIVVSPTDHHGLVYHLKTSRFSMFPDLWTWISTWFSFIWKQSSAYVVFRSKRPVVPGYRGGNGMIWFLLPHISLHPANLFRVTLTEIVVGRGTHDMIGTWKHHRFTLWGLSLIFQNVQPRDSGGMTSWLAGGAWRGVCLHAVAHSQSRSTPVQRQIALGAGNSASLQLLYNRIESNCWKWGF